MDVARVTLPIGRRLCCRYCDTRLLHFVANGCDGGDPLIATTVLWDANPTHAVLGNDSRPMPMPIAHFERASIGERAPTSPGEGVVDPDCCGFPPKVAVTCVRSLLGHRTFETPDSAREADMPLHRGVSHTEWRDECPRTLRNETGAPSSGRGHYWAPLRRGAVALHEDLLVFAAHSAITSTTVSYVPSANARLVSRCR
jgi:hypothetical protein